MNVNHDLIWDYQFSSKDMETEAFRRWYVARVLTRGGANDIRTLGLKTIRQELPHLHLHPRIRNFWTWYLTSSHA